MLKISKLQFGKSRIFLLFCLSLVLGVFLGQFLNYYVMAALAMIFFVTASLFWADKRLVIGGFLGLTMLVGAWRFQTSFPYEEENFIGKYYGQKVEIEGVVIKDPDIRSDKVNLTIGKIVIPAEAGIQWIPDQVRDDRKIVGNILLNLGKYPEYQYGDKLKISGKIEEPFETEEFSYKDYLSRFDTYAVMRFPRIEKTDSGQGNPVVAVLLEVKHKFISISSQIFPEPHNALLLGLILGLKRALPEHFREALVLTGVSHIVVISGYNISMITRNILRTRAWIGRRAAFWLSLITVMGFVILTGADASVVRAAIMGMLVVLALNLGRMYQSLNALIFVATLMVLQNPKILGFDIGFQLSFLATLGLIYLADSLEKRFQKVPNFAFLQFRTNLASTLAALTFTLPLLIYYFDRLSLVAILVNVLILWAVPYLMYSGIVLGLAGILFLPVAKILAPLILVLLEYIIGTVEFFASLPLVAVSASITVPIIVIYYFLLAVVCKRLNTVKSGI